MYRVKKFRVRTKEEIMKDLDECRDYYGPYVSRVFFADGDALVVRTELLLELLAYVHKNFPYVERITSYGTAKDVLAKSEEDLKALAAAGLEMVYIGAESGDDRVLEHIHKDVTAAQIAAAGIFFIVGRFSMDFFPWTSLMPRDRMFVRLWEVAE